MPGGSSLSTVCDAAVTCASAAAMVHVLLKEALDHAIAAQRLRFDVLDVADLRGQVALIEVDDAPGHVVRRKPVVGPDHADDRDVDVGEDVDRGAPRGEHAEDGDDQ